MARRTVVEVQCSRCARKELVDEAQVPQIGTTKAFPAISIHMADGTVVEFEDLCGPCKAAVGTHVEAIGKKIEGVSPERKKAPQDVTDKVLGEWAEAQPKREAKKKGPTTSDPSST
jgi:hypothetical protein